MKKQSGSGNRVGLNGSSESVSRRSFLATAGAAGLTVATGGCARSSQSRFEKKDRILEVMNGEKPQRYVPAAFFMHFDYSQFGGDEIKTHLAYRDYVDMDVVKVQYEYLLTQESIWTCPQF